MHVFFEFPGKKYQVEFSHFKVLPPQILLKTLAISLSLSPWDCLPSLGTSSHQMVMGNGKTLKELAVSNPGSFLKWTWLLMADHRAKKVDSKCVLLVILLLDSSLCNRTDCTSIFLVSWKVYAATYIFCPFSLRTNAVGRTPVGSPW